MVYNAKNAEEAKGVSGDLPKDSIFTGVITTIEDGIVKQFIKEEVQKTWQGDIESPAIMLTIEVKVGADVKELVKIQQMFTYIAGDGGKTLYSTKSNLGKYVKKYDKLPEAGDQVKIITNENGFGKIKIE
jgi:hypothetical protein